MQHFRLIIFFISTFHFGYGLQVKEAAVIDLTGVNLSSEILNFEAPLKVNVLLLDSCSLNTLPEAIKELTNLKHLSLVNNKALNFESLKVLVDLKKLESLNLSGNGIIQLPVFLGDIHKLKNLRLTQNRLNVVENRQVLLSCKRLRRLWIDDNDLHVLDSVFLQMKSLTFLYAYNNKINDLLIPRNQSKSLWELHLGNNRFMQLSPKFAEIKGLLMLMLNDNRITTIPELYKKRKNYNFFALTLNDNPIADKEWMKKCFKALMLFEG